jgi:leucyl-tRNA synthetase
VIGRVTRRSEDWEVREMPAMRLHARVIVRDRQAAFVGSQSLRTTELDARREVGIILRDKNVVKKIAGTFDDDWERAAEVSQRADKDAPASKLAKKVAKSIVNELPPVAPVVAEVVEELTGSKNGIVLNEAEMEESIKQAVKQAVKGAVREAVERA